MDTRKNAWRVLKVNTVFCLYRRYLPCSCSVPVLQLQWYHQCSRSKGDFDEQPKAWRMCKSYSPAPAWNPPDLVQSQIMWDTFSSFLTQTALWKTLCLSKVVTADGNKVSRKPCWWSTNLVELYHVSDIGCCQGLSPFPCSCEISSSR